MNDASDARPSTQRCSRVIPAACAACCYPFHEPRAFFLCAFSAPLCWDTVHAGNWPAAERPVSLAVGVSTCGGHQPGGAVRETDDQTGQLLARARSGDGDAFAELTGPFRRELQVHCYRILGSAADAEDMLQETMMAAWRGLDRFRGTIIAADLAARDRHQQVPESPARYRSAPLPSACGAASRAHAQRRAALAGAVPRRAAWRPAGCRPGTRGAVRGQGIGVAGVRHRPAAPAAPAARRTGAPRRARVPRTGDGGRPRLHRGRREQPAQASPGHDRLPPAARRARPGPAAGLRARAAGHGPVRRRVRARGRRGGRRLAHRRRLAHDAAAAVRVPGPRTRSGTSCTPSRSAQGPSASGSFLPGRTASPPSAATWATRTPRSATRTG